MRVLLLSLVAATFSLAGCQGTGAVLHPQFESKRPLRVDLAQLENATIHDLTDVGFGGLFQRAVRGPRKFNVESLLSSALVEALERKGFKVSIGASGETDYRSTAAGSEKPAFDAVLYTKISGWRSVPSNPASAVIKFSVELVDVLDGTTLYTAGRGFEMRERRGMAVGKFLESGLNRAGIAVLDALPAKQP